VIPAYLRALEQALSFDRKLAHRVCQEVEMHLLDAVAADAAVDRREAAHRAIARFGAPEAMARQFAGVSLIRHARACAASIVMIVFAVFLAMKARLHWYSVTQWTISPDDKSLAQVVLSIDRYAFWISVLLGVLGYLMLSPRKLVTADPRNLRTTNLFCALATGALALSVVTDALLTGLQLRGWEMGAAAALPLFTMICEIAGVGFLGLRLLWLLRRTRAAAALLGP